MSDQLDRTSGLLELLHTSVIDLPAARIDRLQELINFLIAHLLAKVCEDCSYVRVSSRGPIIVMLHVLYRSWPTPMNPVISLSKTWNPRQYSSGSPGSESARSI